jgi:hypothetical protein
MTKISPSMRKVEKERKRVEDWWRQKDRPFRKDLF